jgi:hypothetical protein
MSTTSESFVDALPDPLQAYNHLFTNVHSRVFFDKLAAAGVGPATEQEAQELMQLAGQLRQVSPPVEKQASSRFSQAVNALGDVASQLPGNRELAVKQAAVSVLQDPSVYQSLLSLHLHEAALTNAAVS